MDRINNLQQESMLRVGTILRGIYRIDSYLSSGGFGNTYVATNIEFNERYAIKEFFMNGVTQRDGDSSTVSVSNSINQDSFLQQKEKFKKEARRLRQLNNPHIVKVHDLFEENGTAYYVMDYVDGENLSTRLKRTGLPIKEVDVNNYLPQILDALQTVHDAGIWHLDLKPANIMVDKTGLVKLIDFGASKQLNAQKGGATTSTAISYTNGFAPREQMEQNYDKFGPWTDLYALGATLYNLLTNQRPPLPTDIDDDMSDDKHLALPMPNVSDKMKQLILWLMKTNRMQRPKTILDVKNFECPESHNDVVSPEIINEPTKKELEMEETMIGGKKEDENEENKNIALEEFQRTNRPLLNNVSLHYFKKWVSVLLIIAIICFIGILSPVVVSTWGTSTWGVHNGDWVLWGIASQQLEVFYIPCSLFFHIIKVLMFLIFFIGLRRCSRVLSYITVSCVSFEIVLILIFLSIIFHWQKMANLFHVNDLYNIVCYCLFISNFCIGVYIVKQLGGALNKFGVFLIGYSVASILFTFVQGFGFGSLGYWIEITWIIAMWWILTRKEVVNESN